MPIPAVHLPVAPACTIVCRSIVVCPVLGMGFDRCQCSCTRASLTADSKSCHLHCFGSSVIRCPSVGSPRQPGRCKAGTWAVPRLLVFFIHISAALCCRLWFSGPYPADICTHAARSTGDNTASVTRLLCWDGFLHDVLEKSEYRSEYLW